MSNVEHTPDSLRQLASSLETFVGHHRFHGGGSFEVFYTNEGQPGFYWWDCSPGCLPDGGPIGPFPTAEGAYLDAIGD